MRLRIPSLLLGAFTALACSSSDASPSGQAYPAFELDEAQLSVNRTATIAAPKIVTITWAGDPNAPIAATTDNVGWLGHEIWVGGEF